MPCSPVILWFPLNILPRDGSVAILQVRHRGQNSQLDKLYHSLCHHYNELTYLYFSIQFTTLKFVYK
jgi:hypothetical protein